MVGIRAGQVFNRGRNKWGEWKPGGDADVLLGNIWIAWYRIGRNIVNAVIRVDVGLDAVAVGDR